MEIWKDIEGYEGLYQVSSEGRIKSLARYIKNNLCGELYKEEKIKKITYNPKLKYGVIGLSYNGNNKQEYIHRIVAKTFIPNPNNLPEVNHKNGLKHDNRVENLEWNTHNENIQHSINVLGNRQDGEYNNASKLTNNDVLKIRNDNRIHREIAKDYGVSRSCITIIKNYKSHA